MEFTPRPPDERLYQSRRAYALVEGIEPQNPEEGERCDVFLDAMDADWFDGARDSTPIPYEVAREAPISILTVEEEYRRGPFTGDAGKDEPAWWEINLHGSKMKAWHFASLFHDPIGRGIDPLRRLSPDESRRLQRATSLDDFEDAAERDIRDALMRGAVANNVAVYDIGHGNCNALRTAGVVELYFDFGGGALWNRNTYPPSIRFCYSRPPPVVLSHWDWDHWASGELHREAQELDWVVPRQASFGPNHRRMAATIAARGRLLIWPAGLDRMPAGPLEVVKCLGRSRNDSGLALYLDDPAPHPADPPRARLLLPGDAAYPDIPDSGTTPLKAMVASHHGGNRSRRGVPPPCGLNGRIAYSWGDNNKYNHPSPGNEQEHTAAGWANVVHTASRGGPRGHVCLTGSARRPACNGGQCSLDLTK